MANSSPNPRIRVREATPADLDAIVDVHFSAFNFAIDHLMYPGGPSEESKRRFGQRIAPWAATNGNPPKRKPFLYVAEYLPEDGAPEIVAFAKWSLQAEPMPEEEWKAMTFNITAEEFGDDCNIEVVNAFIGDMRRKTHQHDKGEASFNLGILACKPDRQRLGAGSALVKWGVDYADSQGLPSWVEASPVGYKVYRKFGYQDVDVHDLNLTERWGVSKTSSDENWGENNAVEIAGPAPDGVLRTVIMRRPAKAASS